MAVKKRFSGKITFDQTLESNEEENIKSVLGKPFQAGGKKIHSNLEYVYCMQRTRSKSSIWLNRDREEWQGLGLEICIIIEGFQRRQWHPTPVLLPGKSHGRRSLVGCSPWGHGESDTTERLHFHFSLSCIGEGNGSPLQSSCLENPRDRGARWAAVYGVAQSRTRLKQLGSSRRI